MSRTSPRTGPRRLAVLIVPLFVVLALSGCLGGEEGDLSTVDATVDACVEGPGVREVHILPGSGMPDSPAWYDPAEPDLTDIHTICWVNDDDVMHRILAMPHSIETTPAWVLDVTAAASAGDAHGGHGGHGGHGDDHGGGLMVFDVTFGAGERLAMPLDDTYSALMVHCHPHPWMETTWSFTPATELEYPTEVGHVMYKGNATGDTKATESATSTFNVSAPNLRTVRAVLEWNDADDDKQGLGTTLNKADKLRLEIKDPAGTVVASGELSNRQGTLSVEHQIPIEWPTAVKAKGLDAAATKLATEKPDDMTGAGTWTAVVTVVMANGATNADGNTAASIDGHEDWTLEFQAVHEYAKVLPAGRSHMVLANPTAVVPIQ